LRAITETGSLADIPTLGAGGLSRVVLCARHICPSAWIEYAKLLSGFCEPPRPHGSSPARRSAFPIFSFGQEALDWPRLARLFILSAPRELKSTLGFIVENALGPPPRKGTRILQTDLLPNRIARPSPGLSAPSAKVRVCPPTLYNWNKDRWDTCGTKI